MKKFDEEGLRLCTLQAKVFSESAESTECSSFVFIRRFMNSKVAARMDKRGFLLEASDVGSILEEIEIEYGETTYGKEKADREELYWMGYIYRYWAYTYEESSKQVYRSIKPKELRKLYFPYHSLDPAQAIERIIESKGLSTEDYTERGVKILRQIMLREGTYPYGKK